MRALACLAMLALAGEAFGDARPPKPAGPNIESPSAVAIDTASGDVLFERRADDVRPIASMTKLFAAIVLRMRVDFAASTTITADDVLASRGGAQSPLREGQTFSNSDLLDAMMMSYC
jgi:D-alanyl-D-alanine carboxypeptidase